MEKVPSLLFSKEISWGDKMQLLLLRSSTGCKKLIKLSPWWWMKLAFYFWDYCSNVFMAGLFCWVLQFCLTSLAKIYEVCIKVSWEDRLMLLNKVDIFVNKVEISLNSKLLRIIHLHNKKSRICWQSQKWPQSPPQSLKYTQIHIELLPLFLKIKASAYPIS